MTGSPAQLVVVSPPELARGFRLAGAATRSAETAADAAEVLETLIGEGERGVIAVYEPFLAQLDASTRDRLAGSVSPVIVPLPSGLGAEADASRRARLAALLQKAVGYHITFGEGEA